MKLNIGYNQINNDYFENFLKSENNVLEELNLEGNYYNQKSIISLLKTLSSNNSLKILNILVITYYNVSSSRK